MNQKNGYIYLDKDIITKFFEINGSKLYLKSSGARPIRLNVPFKIDENIAKISAMILDGSLNKNFYNIMFSQKKDKNKVKEFGDIIRCLFGIEPKFREFNNARIVIFSNKALSIFLNKCLDVHKSDEDARIPYWVWISPRPVVIEYLRYAFAMEGSISHYLKYPEIKFHSVDISYLKDLSELLKDKFNINSKIQKYYIKGYGWKYYLYFANQNDIVRFDEIGFALNSHQLRLKKLINSFKNKAWEITLVSILKINKKIFTLTDVNNSFPYLCRRSVHNRLFDLVNKDYIKKEGVRYSLTGEGKEIALYLKDKIRIIKLRTNPKENEDKVVNYLKSKGIGYRNKIARELKINRMTVKDTLNRLIKEDKIKFVESDKFQRKFYKIKN